MNLNKAFKRSIYKFFYGKGAKEINQAQKEEFAYTLETLEAIAEELVYSKKEKPKKKSKKKVKETDADGA